MLQMKNTDRPLEGYGPLWTSPERDIVVLFPVLLERATGAAVASGDLGPERFDELRGYISRMKDFLDNTMGQDRPADVTSLLKRTGLLDQEMREIESVVGKWCMRALFGAYFTGCGEAFTRQNGAVRLDDLNALLEGGLEAFLTKGVP